jgi:Spy/CpxP family protein refolding chaperone
MKPWIAALLALLAAPAPAQQHEREHGPYAGMQQRAVKALSEQQIADLQAGKGMGLALAAELNGYPGPIHVLELGDQLLNLSAEQRRRVQQLYEAMKAEAIAAGEKLIESERALDQEFAAQKMTEARLTLLAAQIGERQGALKVVHLKYHLSTAELLSAEQRQRYSGLRGYR